MRTCLINVPNTYELVGNDPVIIKDQQGVYPPLGILYIASCLKEAGKHEIHVIDSQADELTHAELAEKLYELKPDVVGLTAMTFTLVDCKLTIQEIRKRFDPIIVVGGPHTAIYPSECFNKDGLAADFVVVGEGELTFQRLLDDIETGKVKRYSSIDERTYRQLTFIQDLNQLPFPARELTHIDNYYSVLAYETPTSTAFSSRGCPFSCRYCLLGSTNILMADLTWKEIKDIKVGDKVIGASNKHGGRTRYEKTRVTCVHPVRKATTYKIVTNEGEIHATAEHPWLEDHNKWKTTQDYRESSGYIRFLCHPERNREETIDYKQGYVCGALNGDGYVKRYKNPFYPHHTYASHRIRLVGDLEMMEAVKNYSCDLGVPMHMAKFNGGHYKKCTQQLVTHESKHYELIEHWFNIKSPEFERGFIAGFFDADGSWTSCLRFHGQDKELLLKIKKILMKRGISSEISNCKIDKTKKFHSRKPMYVLTAHGGVGKILEFLSWCKPKVSKKLFYWNNGPTVHHKAKVKEVRVFGYKEVHNIETKNHTFIANGFVSHNCDRPALGKGFRAMNAMRMVNELEDCQKKGIKEMFYYDDTFSVSMKRVEEFCDEKIRRNIHMKWDIRTRVNVVTEALLEKMAQAGCDRIHFGVESGNPRVVKEMNKGTSIKQVEDAFRLCKKYKIKTLAYFMLGNPTETEDDLKDTLRLSQKIKPDFMQMTILSPFPATQYYLEALKNNVISVDVWKNYANTINDDFRPPLWTQPGGIYTREELEKQMRWFYSKFYLTPKFIFDRVKEVRNLGQFKRYASAGLSLLSMTLIPEKKLKDSWRTRNETNTANSARPEAAVAV